MTTPQTRSPKRSARPGATGAGRPSGRFARASQPSGRASRPRPARSPSATRGLPSVRRRKPEPQSPAKKVLGAAQSAPKSALSAIGGVIPGGSSGKKSGKKGPGKAKKAARSAQGNKKPLGVALVAGAAGLALSQREKIAGKLGRGGGGDEEFKDQSPTALNEHDYPPSPATPPTPPAPPAPGA
jgi:hypothetical protein